MKQIDKEIIGKWMLIGSSFAIALFLLLFLCLISGCSPKTVYLPAESRSVSTDTLIQTRWLTDYRVEKDSVLVFAKGDTVIVRDTKWRTRDVEKHDTIYVAKHDTVSVREPYPVEKRVEVAKPLSWWQKSLIWLGIASLALIVLLAIRWYRKR